MSRFGAGIRRGVMAADRFTQIANGLFRDPRLSFKAKGIFGLISTHRDGWRMGLTDLARHSRDGEAAVKSGLKELEKHGFLLRERERHPNGTLRAAAYFITDLPSLQNSRSQPMSGLPPVDNPTSVNRPTKNTNRKKTNKQKTSTVPPCDRSDIARTPQGTDQPDAPASPPAVLPADEMHPGIQLLLEIGASRPDLLLTGKVLTDQGRVATVMLESGWSSEQLRHVITDRPLPHPVRTSVGTIIAARHRSGPPRNAFGDRGDALPVDGIQLAAPASHLQVVPAGGGVELVGRRLKGRVLPVVVTLAVLAAVGVTAGVVLPVSAPGRRSRWVRQPHA